MKKIIYWIKNIFHLQNANCSHFCVTCRFYDRCVEDLSILYIGKNEDNTANCIVNEELEKAS